MFRESGMRKSTTLIGLVSVFIFISMSYYVICYIQANQRLRIKHSDLMRIVEKCSAYRSKCDENLKMCRGNEALFTKSNRELQYDIAGKEKRIADMDQDLHAVKTRMSNAYSFFVFVKEFLGNFDELGSVEKDLSPVIVDVLKRTLIQWKSELSSVPKLNNSLAILVENHDNLTKAYKSLEKDFETTTKVNQQLTLACKNAKDTHYGLIENIRNLSRRYTTQQHMNGKLEEKVNMYKSYIKKMNSTFQLWKKKYINRNSRRTIVAEKKNKQNISVTKSLKEDSFNLVTLKNASKQKDITLEKLKSLHLHRKNSTKNYDHSKEIMASKMNKNIDFNHTLSSIKKGRQRNYSVLIAPENRSRNKFEHRGHITQKKASILNGSYEGGKNLSNLSTHNIPLHVVPDPESTVSFDELEKYEPYGIDDTLDNHGLSVNGYADGGESNNDS